MTDDMYEKLVYRRLRASRTPAEVEPALMTDLGRRRVQGLLHDRLANRWAAPVRS